MSRETRTHGSVMEESPLLRVTSVPEHAGETRLILEGEISAEWVQVLEQQCLRLIEGRSRVVLDFKSVTSVDRRGIRMLRQLPSPQCRLVDCSPVIADLIQHG